MQNKPNLLIPQMNVSYCFTMNYEQITMNDAIKNKAKQTQFQNKVPSSACPAPNRFFRNLVRGSSVLQSLFTPLESLPFER